MSSSCAGPSFLFPKVVVTLVWRMGESFVPKKTLGLEHQAGETQGGVSISGAIGEGA